MKSGKKTNNNNGRTISRSAGTPARVGSKPSSVSPMSPSKPMADTNALKPTSKMEWKPGGVKDPTREAVAEAAYFLWRERGGSAVVNWLEAEARLRRQTAK